MEENYVCRYMMMHDKPCKDNNPSSNNGWIYTAYENATMGGMMPMMREALMRVFVACNKDGNEDFDFFIWRLPEKKLPPISRDEIVGMVSLGFQPLKYGWFMYREPMELGIGYYLKAIKCLFKIRKEHRNYFWRNNLREAYPVAMKLWWHDRHYIEMMQKGKSTLFQWVMFNIYTMITLSNADPGQMNLLWLQLKDLKSLFWIRFIKREKNFYEYFGKDHPLVKEVRDENRK